MFADWACANFRANNSSLSLAQFQLTLVAIQALVHRVVSLDTIQPKILRV